MAAFAIVHVSNRFHRPEYAKIFAAVFIFSLAIFMSSCTYSNQDSPLWLKESTISTTYSLQEVYGAGTLISHSDSVFSDSRYGSSVIGVNYGDQHTPFVSEDLLKRENSIFIWRNYMLERPIRMFKTLEGYYKPVESNVILGQNYLEKLNQYQKVYENDDISGYFIHTSI